MKFVLSLSAVAGLVLASGALCPAQTAATQPATATSQPATQAAPASQLPLLAGKWTVRHTAASNTSAIGQIVTDIAAAETWQITVNKDTLTITEERVTKAGKPFSKKEKATTQMVAMEVSGLSVAGDKATFVVKETPLKKAQGATVTTTYHLQLVSGSTITGTYSRDRDIASLIGSVRSHEDGSVELVKTAQ